MTYALNTDIVIITYKITNANVKSNKVLLYEKS